MEHQSSSINQGRKMSDVAKYFKIGRNTMFKTLREKKILNGENVPRERYVRRGFFTVEHRQYDDRANQEFRSYYVTLVTPEGEQFIKQAIQGPVSSAVQNNAG